MNLIVEHMELEEELFCPQPNGFNILKYRTPKDNQICFCITEIGRTFTAKYSKFKSIDGGVFSNDELDDGYRDKVIYWKGVNDNSLDK